MIAVLVILGASLFASLVLMAVGMASAPWGYEDEDGFHQEDR